jgi:hypothetical protein
LTAPMILASCCGIRFLATDADADMDGEQR